MLNFNKVVVVAAGNWHSTRNMSSNFCETEEMAEQFGLSSSLHVKASKWFSF
jgi:hypothetical protein